MQADTPGASCGYMPGGHLPSAKLGVGEKESPKTMLKHKKLDVRIMGTDRLAKWLRP